MLTNVSQSCFSSPLSIPCLKESAINGVGFVAGAALPFLLGKIGWDLFGKSQGFERYQAKVHVITLTLGAIGCLAEIPYSLLLGSFVTNNLFSSVQPIDNRFPHPTKLTCDLLTVVDRRNKKIIFPTSKMPFLFKSLWASFLLGLTAYGASYSLSSSTPKITNLTSYMTGNAAAYITSSIAGYYFEKKHAFDCSDPLWRAFSIAAYYSKKTN